MIKAAKEQYKVYLEKMEKEIHDEKMKRFVQQTVLSNTSPTRSVKEIKRVDTNLGKKDNDAFNCEDISITISPSHQRKPFRKGNFIVKPTEINHFTG